MNLQGRPKHLEGWDKEWRSSWPGSCRSGALRSSSLRIALPISGLRRSYRRDVFRGRIGRGERAGSRECCRGEQPCQQRCRSSAGRALGASEVVRTLMLLLMRGLAVEDAIGLYRRAPLSTDTK